MNKILFTHIPKTAGTTFRHILDFNFKKDEVLRCDGRKSFMIAKGKKVFMGHIPYGMHKYRPWDKFDYIVFFRDPITRTVSHYYFVLNSLLNTGNKFHQDNSIEEILNDEDQRNFGTLRSNLQCRFLYGFDALSGDNISDSELLNQAKLNLKNNYKTFGIQEKFEESVIKMCADLKLDYNPKLIQSKNKVTAKKGEISNRTMQVILEKNKLDIELYEYAIKLKYS